MLSIKDFSFEHWWTLVAAAGAAIAVVSIPVHFITGLLIGIGLLGVGVGEWANHPRQAQKETIEGLKGFRVVQAYPWKPNAFGLILDVVGLGLLGFGLYELVLAT